MASNKYIQYLSDKTKDESFVDRLKIKFRPLIFPVELLLNQIHENDTIFDIGCGSGQFSLLAVHFKKISKVYGVEISQKLVKNAENLFAKHTKNVAYEFFQYDGNTFPKNIAECNIVFLNDVLHHIPQSKQIKFLEDLFQAMSIGSRFVLKDIDASSFLVYFNKLHDLIFASEIGKEISLSKALKVLETIGFEIIEYHRENIAVYPHYTIICKK